MKNPIKTSSQLHPLFRQQVLNQVASKQYGTVILAKSLSFRFLTTVLVMLAVAIMVFFSLFSTTRNNRGHE